jgi:hypothetical protein
MDADLAAEYRLSLGHRLTSREPKVFVPDIKAKIFRD